jgi:hypothetical protein
MLLFDERIMAENTFLIYQAFNLNKDSEESRNITHKKAKKLNAGLEELAKQGFIVMVADINLNGVPMEIIIGSTVDGDVKSKFGNIVSPLKLPYYSGHSYLPLNNLLQKK